MQKNLRVGLVGLSLVAALTIAGCSSAAPSETGTATSAGQSGEAAAAAKATVDAARAPIDEFVAPGPSFDTSAIAGGVVYYIVPALEISLYQQYADALQEAFSEFDLELQPCGTSGASPDGIANCLTQAVDAKASGVIAMTIPYELAPTSFDALTAAGIPLIYGLTSPTGPGDPQEVAYFSPDFTALQTLGAEWIIADSNGAANVVVVKETGNPAAQSWTEEGTLPAFADGCPDCTVKTIDSDAAQPDRLTTDITAAFVANPSINYVHVVSENYLSAVIAGAQAAGKSASNVKVSSMNATAANITQIQDSQWLAGTVGIDIGAGAWYLADQTLRLLAGEPAIEEEEFPFTRLFDRDNASDLEGVCCTDR